MLGKIAWHKRIQTANIDTNVPAMIGNGKREIMVELMREHNKLRQNKKEEKLKECINNCLCAFSKKFFEDENAWTNLSLEKKEAFYELMVRDAKIWLLKILAPAALLNAGIIVLGTIMHPGFFLSMVLNIVLWKFLCPKNPITPVPTIRLLLSNKKTAAFRQRKPA